MEIPWRTLGSAHPGDQPAGGAASRRSTWKVYAGDSTSGACAEEPRRGHWELEEEMDVGAVGTHGVARENLR